MSVASFKLRALAVLMVVCFGAQKAQADGDQVEIFVRAVEASESVSGESAALTRDCILSSTIEDLRPNLSKLNYKRFNLLSSARQLLPVLKKQTLSLAGGQSLAIRPLYVDAGKVGLWLRWRDKEGSDLLDTRMHVQEGENVIAGTEGDKDNAIILVIGVGAGQSVEPAGIENTSNK